LGECVGRSIVLSVDSFIVTDILSDILLLLLSCDRVNRNAIDFDIFVSGVGHQLVYLNLFVGLSSPSKSILLIGNSLLTIGNSLLTIGNSLLAIGNSLLAIGNSLLTIGSSRLLIGKSLILPSESFRILIYLGVLNHRLG